MSGSISIEAPASAAELLGERFEFDAGLITAEQGQWEIWSAETTISTR